MSTSLGDDRGTVLITGTSRGIGNRLALRFLTLGYHVTGISRSETAIDHPRFRSVTADLSDAEQVNALSETVRGESVVGLINNAGIHGPIGSFETAPMERWINTFQVNLFGAAALTQACIPSLRQNNGFIIFFSGGGSAFPRSNFSPYGVSKTAVVRLAEVLAQELAPHVMVYCVAPGPNPTQLLEEAIRGGEDVPPEDVVEFSDVERLCQFLANNRDSRYSGKFIHVKDAYDQWGQAELAADAHTLRRIDPRTLARINAL